MPAQPFRSAKALQKTWKLYEKGLTLTEIAKKLGIHYVTAFRRVKKMREKLDSSRNGNNL